MAFLDLLEHSSDVYQTEILAYVLMSNHFHLLVKTPRGEPELIVATVCDGLKIGRDDLMKKGYRGPGAWV